MEYLAELKHAIRQVHGCEATHVQTVPVKEIFQGQTVWEGDVEIFDLTGHPKAARCYAWGYPPEGPNRRVIAVLELPPVDSPVKAVRAAIAAQSKK